MNYNQVLVHSLFQVILEEWVEKEFNDDIRELFGVNSWDELRKNGGTAKASEKITVAWKDLKFRTPSGKYEFYSEKAVEYGHHPLPVFAEEYKAPKEYPIRCDVSTLEIWASIANSNIQIG